MKTPPTTKELSLIGLRTVAQTHIEALEALVAAAVDLTGEDDMQGHTSDYIWGSGHNLSPRELLDRFDTPDRKVKG